MARRDDETTWEDFTQRVRRFRPSELTRLIAHVSARQARAQKPLTSPFFPWALSAAATVSLVAGNEHRRGGVSEHDLALICDAYNRLRAPKDLASGHEGAVETFLFRTGFEQFPYQRSAHYELGRPLALLAPREPPPGLRVAPDDWRRTFGASLDELVAAGFVLFVGTQVNDGLFDLSWVDQPNFDDVRKAVAGEAIVRTIKEIFTAGVEDIARRWHETEALFPELDDDPQLRRYLPTPLLETPLVSFGDGQLIAPVVENVLRRLSPEGLYYAARGLFGEDFSRSLGPLFESYVGRQFSSLPNATVWPEVVFGNNERSVDWFVAIDDWLLLVEAKATRMPMAARAGRRDAVHEAVARTLGKGSDQITRSAERIRAGHPAFTHLPSDLRLLGMVVTLEPYYTAMGPFSAARPSASVPLCSVPISEIEFLVAVGQASPLAPTLDRVAAGADLVKELWQLPRKHNPLIAEAWDRLPFG